MLGFFDESVFRFINGTLSNPLFDIVMPVITGIGSGEFIFAVALAVLVFAGKDNKLAGIYLLAGLAVTYYAVDVLKEAMAVPRPFVSLEDARLIVSKARGFSFPSGHSATAFMAATVVSRFFKRWRMWALIACLVAFSRPYVGAHYLSDAIAGSAIGIIIGNSMFIMSGQSKNG